jgi:hypothetical protein
MLSVAIQPFQFFSIVREVKVGKPFKRLAKSKATMPSFASENRA